MSEDHGWSNVERPLYGWVRTVERILVAERIPPLAGPLISIFSDYSGEQKGSSYQTIGVLYADLYGSPLWEMRRRDVRRRFLADGRRMSFKALGDKKRRSALVPFLQAADEIRGLCLVLAIRRSIANLHVGSRTAGPIQDLLGFRKTWSTRELERMARVTHTIGLLIGGLSKPGQHIYWISDQDPLLANENLTLDLREMLGRFTSYYARRELGELGLGTAEIDPGDRFEEDGTAIPDLVAGAFAEILTQVAAHAGGRFRSGVALPFSGGFTAKTEVIHSWFRHRGGSLAKVCIVFEDLGGDGLSVFRLASA